MTVVGKVVALSRNRGMRVSKIGLGLTGYKGFLPGDPQRIICDTWQEAAEGR